VSFADRVLRGFIVRPVESFDLDQVIFVAATVA
jgi:hypothetical protein